MCMSGGSKIYHDLILKGEWLKPMIYLRGEIQMIPESAYKSSASKNWEILWKYKL